MTWPLSELSASLHDASQASGGLLECLPAYEALLEEQPSGQPAWLSNTVLASRMQFLMGMLAPCIPQLPEVRSLPWQQCYGPAACWNRALIVEIIQMLSYD